MFLPKKLVGNLTTSLSQVTEFRGESGPVPQFPGIPPGFSRASPAPESRQQRLDCGTAVFVVAFGVEDGGIRQQKHAPLAHAAIGQQPLAREGAFGIFTALRSNKAAGQPDRHRHIADRDDAFVLALRIVEFER